MSSLKRYHEQLLAELGQYSEEEIRQVRAQLRKEFETAANENIAETRETIQRSNEEALAYFNKGMAKLEEQRQKGTLPPIFFETSEHLLKKTLDGILNSNKRFLDTLVAKTQEMLQRYQD